MEATWADIRFCMLETSRVFEGFTDVGPVDDLIRLIEFKAKYYLIQTSIIR